MGSGKADEEKEGRDRRNNTRVESRFLVEYETVEDFLIDYTSNMSIGGLFIRTREPLPVGTRFKMRFRVEGHLDPVEVMGQVCWIQQVGGPGPLQPGMGVQFTEMAEQDLTRIQAMLKDW